MMVARPKTDTSAREWPVPVAIACDRLHLFRCQARRVPRAQRGGAGGHDLRQALAEVCDRLDEGAAVLASGAQKEQI